MKKVLVAYCRYGSGHKSIAEYVYNYIEKNNPSYQVLLLDMTDYMTKFGNIGFKLFDYVTKHKTGKLFDICYEAMDNKFMTLTHNKVAKKSFDNFKLRRTIANFNPDILISSHFYCSDIINYYNKLHLINTKIYTIITDYHTHECWTKNHLDENGFIVGNELVRDDLIKRGIDKNKIYCFGLPLNIDKIRKLSSKENIIKKYNLNKDKMTILFFGGSTAGNLYYYDYFKALIKANMNVNIIFVSGKNSKLENKCHKYVYKNNIKNVTVMGYTNDALNLIKVSDFVITKPGGATVTECMEIKTPMILVPGLGGQEKYNAKFLKKKKYGIKVNNIWQFKKVMKSIKNNRKIINKLQNNLNKLDENKSIEEINNLVKKEINNE